MSRRNRSHPLRHRLVALLTAAALAFAGLLGTGTAAASELPSLGSETGGELTAAQEVEIGQQFLAQARRHLEFVHDPEVVEYVRLLGHRVAAQTGFDAYPFHFYVVKDPSLNAFAVPGGHIFMHSGLIEETESVAELAGVLAHEVAHITQRHMARQVAASKRSQASSLLLVAAAILAGMQGQGEAATALVAGASAYSRQEMLAYSRAHEREADRLGIQYLAAAGFDPRGLPNFLRQLQAWSQLQGAAPPAYLSSHPLTGERIADAAGRASQLGGDSDTPLGQETFARIKVRLRAVTAESPEQAYQHFKQRLDEAPGDTTARYGLALAAQRSGRLQEAIGELQRLVKDAPEVVAYRRTLAELQLQAGHADAAIAALEAALKRRPGDPALRETLGQALLVKGETRRARGLLLEVTRDYPQRPEGHRALAEAYARLGQSIQAHRAEAEARWLRGQRTEALEQLRLAKRLAQEKGSPQLAQIEARIQELTPAER